MSKRNRKRRPTPPSQGNDLARRQAESELEDDLPEDLRLDFQYALDDGVLGRGVPTLPRLDDVLLEAVPVGKTVDWSLMHPPVIEVRGTDRRLLAVGRSRRVNARGAVIYQDIELFIGGRQVDWQDLVPVSECCHSCGAGEVAIKVIPYVEGYLGRAKITANGWDLPTYTTWFATTSEGIRIPPRKTLEQQLRPGDD